MPVTLFHLGPGLAHKSVASRHVSFTIFAFTQILIDMHYDIKPFAPFIDENGLYGIITLDQLDVLCGLSGILGLLILTALGLIRKKHKTALLSDGGYTS